MQGKQHIAATSGVALTTLLTSGLVYLGVGPKELLQMGVGAICGLLLIPDHDVDNGNITYLMMRKMLRTDWPWRVFWRPYAVAFKHRSPWSHWPVLSTILRWVYLLLPVITLLLHDDRRPKLLTEILPAQLLALISWCVIITIIIAYGWVSLFYLILGNMLPDTLHFLQDK